MWPKASREFPILWSEIELIFLAFPTTWLAESGFSALARLQTQSRNRLNIVKSGDLRLALSTKKPSIEELIRKPIIDVSIDE